MPPFMAQAAVVAMGGSRAAGAERQFLSPLYGKVICSE